MAEAEVLRAPLIVEYPFTRTTGPVIGAFALTLVRELGQSVTERERLVEGLAVLATVLVLRRGLVGWRR